MIEFNRIERVIPLLRLQIPLQRHQIPKDAPRSIRNYDTERNPGAPVPAQSERNSNSDPGVPKMNPLIPNNATSASNYPVTKATQRTRAITRSRLNLVKDPARGFRPPCVPTSPTVHSTQTPRTDAARRGGKKGRNGSKDNEYRPASKR